MKISSRLFALFLVVGLLGLVGCFGGDGDDSSSILPSNLNPNPQAVPAAKVLDATTSPITSPTVQVQQAVTASLKTLVSNGLAPQNLRASVVPAGVPGLGSNEAVNVQFLLGSLLAALPTGGNIEDGLLIDNTDPSAWNYQIATYTAADKTLEVARIESKWDYQTSTNKKVLVETFKLTGCDATVTDGVLSQMSIQAGATLTTTSYKDDGSVEGTVKITIASGAKIEASTSKTADNTFVMMSQYGEVQYGRLRQYTGVEKTKITLAAPAKFDVVFNEGNRSADGSITLNSISGTYEVTSNFEIAISASKTGSAQPVAVSGATPWKSGTGDDSHVNNLAFAGNALQIQFNINWKDGEVSVQNGLIQMNNMTKVTRAGEVDSYSFNNGSVSLLVKYSGKDYEKYGYIYSLNVSATGFSFDPANESAAGKGAVIEITRTNSDNTVSKLTYKIDENGKPVLQPSTSNFAGGSEKITVDETTKTTSVEGTVTVANSTDAPADAQLKIAYQSKKDTVNNTIRVRATVKVGAARGRTVFFTRQATGNVNDGNVYEDEITSESGTAAANFTVTGETGTYTPAGGTPENFKVEL